MRHTFPLAILIAFALTALSCNDDARKKALEDRKNEGNFFANDTASIDLGNLKNEMASSPTGFLRSFQTDDIPWQRWNQDLLQKAKSAQKPIVILVGTSIGGHSRNLSAEISANPELRKLFSESAVCCVVDTRAHPEMSLLMEKLLREIRRSAQFPSLMWITHEGSPLSSLPIGNLTGEALAVTLTSAIEQVNDTWLNASEYAIEHSRDNNISRQNRIDRVIESQKNEAADERSEVFRYGTRQLSSLYSFGDRDLDHIGGLLPTNSLELLAIGSQSQALTNEVRMRCRIAALEVSQSLVQEGIKDHLTGDYFFARTTTHWSIPAFSKNISTQAKVSHMLIRVGTILGQRSLIEEGKALLSLTEKNWLEKSLVSISPTSDTEEAGKFFWDLSTLKDLLTSEEFSLAVAAFSLQKNGNIPAIADPLENLYQLNTLRRRIPMKELAELQGKTVSQIRTSLSTISNKLLKHRNDNTTFETEEILTAVDLSHILKAQLARSSSTFQDRDLKTALALANRMITEHYDPKKGLSRFPLTQTFHPARCIDYANTAQALLLTYQASLDPKWLNISLKIIEEAMTRLGNDNIFLSEAPEKERVIPVRQHNNSMIFGESSAGTLDHAINRAWAITGDEKYLETLQKHHRFFASSAKTSPVFHTDYISSCALGTHPLLATFHGNHKSPKGKLLLATLNSQKHIPYLTIRAATPSSSTTQASVTLTRNGKNLGQTSNLSSLKKLLQNIISGN